MKHIILEVVKLTQKNDEKSDYGFNSRLSNIDELYFTNAK